MNPRKRKAWNKLYFYAMHDRKMSIQDAELFLRESFDHFCRTGELKLPEGEQNLPQSVQTQNLIPTPDVEYDLLDNSEPFEIVEEVDLVIPDWPEDSKEENDEDKLNKTVSNRGRKKTKQ